MKRNSAVFGISVVMLLLVFIASGCATPVAAKTAPAGVETPAGQASAAATKPQATAAPEATPSAAPTEAPAAAMCPAFQYYNAVKIGMTKAEVDKATGLAAKEAKGEYDPEGSYYYMDSEGYGIYVIFNGGGKLYNKTVQYKDVAKDLAPLTAKPVTEEQCDKITDGMTREDVVKLLGCDGAECSATAVKTETCEDVGPIVRWGNKDGSFLQVVFLPDGTARNAMFFDHG